MLCLLPLLVLLPLLPLLLHVFVDVVVWVALFHAIASGAKWLMSEGCFEGFGSSRCGGGMRKAMAAACAAREQKSKPDEPPPPPDHSSVSMTVNAEAYLVNVSAPGVATTDLDVKMQAGEPPELTVKGATKSRGAVDRTIFLPTDAAVDAATAAHADGLLTITVPRKQGPPPKTIHIAPAAATPSAATPAPPARCDPEKKRVLLSQIRTGVELKKTAPAPTASATPPVAPVLLAPTPTRASTPTPAEAPEAEPAAAAAEDSTSEWEEVAESLDAACLASLEEMGFTDAALNAAMLAKHGSVKGAVKELVALRKERK